MTLADRISVWLSTGFGVSLLYQRVHEKSLYIKERRIKFRGTGAGFFGTLEAALLAAAGVQFNGWQGLAALIVLTVLSVYLTGRAESHFGTKDDSRIVLDEVLGYFWSIAFLPWDAFTPGQRWGFLSSAFILFRIFDVYKIPSRGIQHLEGGWGIMMDDVLSGISVALILNTAARLWL